ncbi:hypothetical protein [Halostagnicola sp. A56]|uniref:hypothetical protein n=1 Tax=Halostagnicola sp. A56 TaxID=1495067 RepID=UPI0012E20A2A|nr:hypothetical protein [Halostagnicola sp. A56]
MPTSEYLNFPAIDLQSQQEIQEWDYEGAITAWKPVVAGDLLYVWGSENPQDGLTLHAVDPKDGDVEWTFDTSGAEDPGVPVILDGLIIFADDGEKQITALKDQ